MVLPAGIRRGYVTQILASGGCEPPGRTTGGLTPPARLRIPAGSHPPLAKMSDLSVSRTVAPARQQMMFDTQLVADTADDEIDGVLQCLRAGVKGRHGR